MHKNNFDFQRLCFSIFVLITHSYPLSGSTGTDFLGIWTDNQLCLSYIGVRGFFVLSGYLILQSLDRSKDIIDFAWKRVLRIFPGLAFALISTLLICGFVYSGTLNDYWHQKEVWTYFPNNFSLYRLQMGIPGVFDTNPFKSAINGSLWTISYEFTMYLLLATLVVFRKLPRFRIVILGLGVLLFGIGGTVFYRELEQYAFFINGGRLTELGTFFLFGAFLAAIKFEQIKFKNWLIIAAILVTIPTAYFGIYLNGFQFLSIGIAVLAFGLQSFPWINTIGHKIGDLSYGIYIFGFPIQQTIVATLHPNLITLLLVSVPVTMLFAWISWHGIEKHALKLKKFHFLSWVRSKAT